MSLSNFFSVTNFSMCWVCFRSHPFLCLAAVRASGRCSKAGEGKKGETQDTPSSFEVRFGDSKWEEFACADNGSCSLKSWAFTAFFLVQCVHVIFTSVLQQGHDIIIEHLQGILSPFCLFLLISRLIVAAFQDIDKYYFWTSSLHVVVIFTKNLFTWIITFM